MNPELSKEELGLFTGRDFFVELLRKRVEDFKHGKKSNIALIGKRYIGKTTIIKNYMRVLEQQDVVAAYFDFEKASITPEDFSVAFISSLCSYFFKKPVGTRIEDLMEIRSELPKKAQKTIELVYNELQKIKPDHKLLLELGFNFSEQLGKKVVLFLDEFWHVLDFENFSQIKDFFSFFNELKFENTMFVVSGSAVELMKKICSGFEQHLVEGLDRQKVKELVEKIVKVGDKEVDAIFRLSQGIPIYAYALALGYAKYKNVKKAFISQTLVKTGIIHNACESILVNSLSRARGRGLLKSILKVLASEQGLRLSEVSRMIYRSAPVTKNLLTRLIDVDLISKEDSLFSITDQTLRYFIEKVWNGIEFGLEVSKEEMKKLEEEL